jgi:hypothetical protein
MITWKQRLEEFKASVIEYIKDAVDKQEGNLQEMVIIGEKKYPYIIIRNSYELVLPFYTRDTHGVESNKEYKDLESLNTEVLSLMADDILSGKLNPGMHD